MTDSPFFVRERAAFSRLKAAVWVEQECLGLTALKIEMRSAALLAETQCQAIRAHKPILVLAKEQAGMP